MDPLNNIGYNNTTKITYLGTYTYKTDVNLNRNQSSLNCEGNLVS